MEITSCLSTAIMIITIPLIIFILMNLIPKISFDSIKQFKDDAFYYKKRFVIGSLACILLILSITVRMEIPVIQKRISYKKCDNQEKKVACFMNGLSKNG